MIKIFFGLMIFMSISCKSQTIVPLYQTNDKFNNGYYYKDTENFQDQFVGNWVLNDNVNYLKITFKKKSKFIYSGTTKTYYKDFLIGEYEYQVNNVTIVNTLNNINVNHGSIFKYNMYSLFRYTINQYPECDDCNVTNRLVMNFQELPTRDPEWACTAYFIIRKVIESGVEKLKVQFIMNHSAAGIPAGLGDEYHGFSLPFGEYTLVRE